MLALPACSPSHVERVRLTANVSLEGRIYSASSVQAYSCREGGGIWYGMDIGGCTAKGEAVAVDIPGRGYLFLLMKSPGRDQTAFVKLILKSRTAPAQKKWRVSDEALPLMVTFQDKTYHWTASIVDPANMASSFGEGVYLDSVTAELTTDPVTDRIGEILPWLSKDEGSRYLLSDRHGTGELERLQQYDFQY